MIDHRALALSVLLQASGLATAQQADSFNSCGCLENYYGPCDYGTERQGWLRVVERAHFRPEVEALVKGATRYIGADLNYTLMTSPNHHRAPIRMTRLAERAKPPRPPDMTYSVAFHFDRAVRF